MKHFLSACLPIKSADVRAHSKTRSQKHVVWLWLLLKEVRSTRRLMITATLSCSLPATSNNPSRLLISTPRAGTYPGLSSNAPISGNAPLIRPSALNNLSWMSTGSDGLPFVSGLSQGGCEDSGQSARRMVTSGLGDGGIAWIPQPSSKAAGSSDMGGYSPIMAMGPRGGNEGRCETGGGSGRSCSQTISGGQQDGRATGPNSESPNLPVSIFPSWLQQSIWKCKSCGFVTTCFRKTGA